MFDMLPGFSFFKRANDLFENAASCLCCLCCCGALFMLIGIIFVARAFFGVNADDRVKQLDAMALTWDTNADHVTATLSNFAVQYSRSDGGSVPVTVSPVVNTPTLSDIVSSGDRKLIQKYSGNPSLLLSTRSYSFSSKYFSSLSQYSPTSDANALLSVFYVDPVSAAQQQVFTDQFSLISYKVDSQNFQYDDHHNIKRDFQQHCTSRNGVYTYDAYSETCKWSEVAQQRNIAVTNYLERATKHKSITKKTANYPAFIGGSYVLPNNDHAGDCNTIFYHTADPVATYEYTLGGLGMTAGESFGLGVAFFIVGFIMVSIPIVLITVVVKLCQGRRSYSTF